MSLIRLADVTLHSGGRSWFKLAADEFIRDNLPGLVALARAAVAPFAAVSGIPTGGLLLAGALAPHASPDAHGLLLVDDVLTTGASFFEARRAAWVARGEPEFVRQGWCRGVVVFARGPCPPFVKALFQLPPELWTPAEGACRG